MFRFQPTNAWTTAWLAAGGFTMGLSLIVGVIPVGKIR